MCALTALKYSLSITLSVDEYPRALKLASISMDTAIIASSVLEKRRKVEGKKEGGKQRKKRGKRREIKKATNKSVISCLNMYHTNVLMYRTMVLLARLTKVRC